MVYLDNAATTQCAPGVAEIVTKYMLKDFANPSSSHRAGREIAENLDSARKVIKDKLGTKRGQVIFTSGGTESNNLAILGLAEYLLLIGKTHIITSSFEHMSVQKCMEHLETLGFEITYLKITKTGMIDINELKESIKDTTGLVSIMSVNNEIGTILPLYEIGEICVQNNILFHTDAVQGFCSVPLDVEEFNIDLLSASGHKIHAPKGVGFLYVKNPGILTPIIKGGEQQRLLRSGTENVPGIMALKYVIQTQKTTSIHTKNEYIQKALKDAFGDSVSFPCRDIGNNKMCPKILSITIKDIDAQTLILALASDEIFVSAGSACNSHTSEPSRVLKSIGLSDKEAYETIRISLSDYTSFSDIAYFINKIIQITNTLKGVC